MTTHSRTIQRHIAQHKSNPLDDAKSGRPWPCTDLGNAERLVALHGSKFRWDASHRDGWRVWDGRRWDLDTTRVRGWANDTARHIRREAAAMPKSENGQPQIELFRHAIRSESRDRLASMVDVARTLPDVVVEADQWDADRMLFNVANGTINLRNGNLIPHNPAHYITKGSSVEYRPGQRCGRFERFLGDATGGDRELQNFLQVVAGYCLTGMTTEETFLIVHGPAASGKTTFLELLKSIMGGYARTIPSELLIRPRNARDANGPTPATAGLVGVRLAAASELDEGQKIAAALVKSLTGGERITARNLYGGFFDYEPQYKIVLALNDCPKAASDDEGLWRRIRRVPFVHSVPPERRDKTLKPYLRSPEGGAPAVLAWAVEGCLRWQREGLVTPAAVENSTAAYRVESDTLAPFMSENLDFNPAAWTSWESIWTAYQNHAHEAGTPERYRISQKRLQDRLKAEGCTTTKRSGVRVWSGVALQTPENLPL